MNLLRFLFELKTRWFRTPRPGLYDLDRKLEAYLPDQKGFFIEAGANDGYLQSNTYFLERTKGWRGLLVEGIPELYEQCCRNRPDADVRNCALVDASYPGETISMQYAHLTSVMDGAFPTAEAAAEHVRLGQKSQHLDRSYRIQVPARTLESVLDDLPNLPPIDFLSLDVEGAEAQVLAGLNLQRYRPKWILVEARFYEEVNQLLTSAGYEQIDRLTKHDVLYRDAELVDES